MAKKIIKRIKKENPPANVIPIAKGLDLPVPLEKSSHKIRKIPAEKKVKSSVIKNWEPTEEDRVIVAGMVATGSTPEEIAQVICPYGPISYSTVIRKFGYELKYGKVHFKKYWMGEIIKRATTDKGAILLNMLYKETWGSASPERRQPANMGHQKSEDEETYFEKVGKEIGGMVDTLPKTPKKVENE